MAVGEAQLISRNSVKRFAGRAGYVHGFPEKCFPWRGIVCVNGPLFDNLMLAQTGPRSRTPRRLG
jgi:hypothetical protein